MEWVETTGRTIEEAKDFALDQLGVDDQEAEFEILEEPKPGLFGRVKGQARVRARVRPKTPPSRDERRRRPAKNKDRADSGTARPASANPTNGADAGNDDESTSPSKGAPAAERAPRNEGRGQNGSRGESTQPSGPRLASDVAEQESTLFLQGILDQFNIVATISIEIDEQGDLTAAIEGDQLGRLIGPRGGVISAIEELCRTRLQHVANGGSTPRFKLDIGSYRASRRPNLELLVDDVVGRVRSTGDAHVLDVVLASERKLVHDRIGETATDLQTHSEGEDPVRRVVVSVSE